MGLRSKNRCTFAGTASFCRLAGGINSTFAFGTPIHGYTYRQIRSPDGTARLHASISIWKSENTPKMIILIVVKPHRTVSVKISAWIVCNRQHVIIHVAIQPVLINLVFKGQAAMPQCNKISYAKRKLLIILKFLVFIVLIFATDNSSWQPRCIADKIPPESEEIHLIFSSICFMSCNVIS